MASRDESLPPERPPLARVHIYGAGIAGLTAAHELAVRGFRVRVYEPAQECDETGKPEGQPEYLNEHFAVGGMARTQYVRAPKGSQGNFSSGDAAGTHARHRFFYWYPEDFVPTEKDPAFVMDDDERMGRFLAEGGYGLGKNVGVLQIRIPPSKDSSRDGPRSDNARGMRTYLTRESGPWKLDPARVVILKEDEAAWLAQLQGIPFTPLEDEEGLWLELVHFLPGEHGFRFFPSYYRHLFATMVETPLLDAQGQPTGRRVFDNLVPSSFYGIAAQGRRIRFLRRAPASRPVEMLQEVQDLLSAGYPPSDTLQFSLRIWRYMCTSPERRKAEYEGISWWEYLEGYEPKTGTRRYHYSEAFKRDMQFAPRVLAAFDGAWGDARTNGNTLAQLYLNNLLPLPKTDGTLNGPTTVAWLRPWRRYLEERLRVQFVPGALTRFALEDGRIVAWRADRPDVPEEWKDVEVQTGYTEDVPAEPVDYYLVATDAATAEQVTRDLPLQGVVEKLRGFTTRIPPNPRGPEQAQPRMKGVLPGQVPWDRFQTLTGIQFFFPTRARLAEGYLYFLDAPWGLSAINSQQYWATPPIFAQDGFASLLSVDIGNWYVREPGLDSPSESSRARMASEVWRQVKLATEQHGAPLPRAAEEGFSLPDPSWFHMDRCIRFEADAATGEERPIENLAPYLIPIVGDWERRPGAEPWDPEAPSSGSVTAAASQGDVWQATHGGYQVHWGRLVFAGTYLKTFTRMTTMESANESARHAVNAIIDHFLAFQYPAAPATRRAGTRETNTVPEYSGQGTLTGSPEFRMTPIGEYCRIWDPEKHELLELAPLRELDAKLFAAGLPHVWDVLQLEPLLPPLLSPLDPVRGAEALKSFLGRVRESMAAIPGLRWP
ncbi:NAD(P)-binding protein [Pyxidicoccus parkwayensis]|uniref:NAD(P)-binding protein n=1 Tax=Pyxidicoccus parkwayensis TaxID=2813578 RepID=A0ABX7NVK4_9BACT|nr:NAD(P)-binding protein [Pyxidicoccus parkwaysis]QSQ22431.1 NAD(P)-binding protein [Pyxidicoccus parkwaysis]